MKDRIALVTGGTSGIGKEIVKQLLLEGCFVFVNFGHSEEMMYEAKKEFKEISENFKCIKADVSNEQEVFDMFEKIKEKFGSGFSRSGLQNMRLFYSKYKNCQPLAGKLSWSHYCYLIYIEDDDERAFYEKECINSKWSKRELKRQIDSSLFQRLLLSKGNTNKKKVYELAKRGQTPQNPIDILREPYVFEFLGIPENKKILESDLEKNLINHLSSFLMELGKGFMYVGNQSRITLDNNTH